MINVLKPKFRTEEIIEQMRICLDKGWTGLGFKTIEFEDGWKDYTSLPYAHFINSATSGLHLALNVYRNLYGWEDGDEIITTPLTFVSSNHAIMYERFTPVFTDVDSSLCLDPEDVLRKITSKTKAVMFVGLGGNAGQLDRISKICKERNIKLILDAAHMAGTFVATGKHVGHEADATIFSFQAVKNLPTSDSGMICFNDEKCDKLARELSWLGINKDTYSRFNNGSYKWKYDVPNVGFKYHGNALTAAIGIVQLKYLEQDNERRRTIANLYKKALRDLDGIGIVASSKYTLKNSRHLFQIIVDTNKRDNIIEALYKQDIYPGVHYIDNTSYTPYKEHAGKCLAASKLSDSLITLPIHCNLSDDDVSKVVKTIKEFYS